MLDYGESAVIDRLVVGSEAKSLVPWEVGQSEEVLEDDRASNLEAIASNRTKYSKETCLLLTSSVLAPSSDARSP